MSNRLWMMMAAATGTLLGCPGDADPNAAGLEFVSSAGAHAAAARGVAGATADPPPPDEKKLCSIQFEVTSFDDAKKSFGMPVSESMDKSKAGLSYRYQGDVSLVLTFDWHTGHPGAGCVLTGIGCKDGKNLLKGYLLSEASITGLPYPACWPHEEP